MKRYVPKTYNNRRVLRILIRAVVAVLLISIVVFVSLFFGLRKYVVYSADGLIRLEIPFLMDEITTETGGNGNPENNDDALDTDDNDSDKDNTDDIATDNGSADESNTHEN